MNMAETFKVADKVMNPESAIELTANMQMLGGAIGDLNDPLKLMYMATNNVEGLQEAIQGAAGSLAVFNSEQGRFEITGANLRRGKEMAAQLGISYSEFAKGAVAAQERLLATDTLLARGFNIDPKEKEFLTNLSQMKDGEMQIVIPKSLQDSLGKEIGKNEIKLNELTGDQVKILKKYQDDLEGKTAEQMANEMLSETKKMSNNLEAMARSLVITGKRQVFGKEGELMNDKDKLIPGVSSMLRTLDAFRKEGLEISKDPGKVGAILKAPIDEIKNMTGVINGGLNLLGQKLDELKESFKNVNSNTQKTKEQQLIEEENKVKSQRQRANNNDGAFIGNLNIKLTKTGFGNDMTIDQTERGYLTPMNNMV
jgi:hypothetical protein